MTNMAHETYPIDFVVTWVDDTDPVWREKKAKHTGTVMVEGNTEARYRDWDNLKYWFRGVEKFAPWVRHVYFVTDDQKPEWLNEEHPKLKWVKHTDFIPREYLPTFNSNAIELNIHRIEGLSEHFVYFNDDVFLIKETKPEDFFVGGKACELPRLGWPVPGSVFSRMLYNNAELINRHMSLRKAIKADWKKWVRGQSLGGLARLLFYGRRDEIPGSIGWHIQASLKKSTFECLWEKEKEKLHQTCRNKLRSRDDVTSYCIRDWQILSGEFHPKRPIGRLFHTASMSCSDDAVNYLRKQKGKVICLNDSEDERDFELHKKMLLDEFIRIFPEKSSFEL